MLSVQVDTGPAKRLLAAVGKLPRGLKKEVADAVRRAAQDVARDARSLIRSKATRRRKSGGSKAGEPPVSRTGALARSIKVVKGRRDGLSYKVQSSFVGRFLEVGTSKGVQQRPFLTRALAARSEQTFTDIVAAVNRALDPVVS